MKVQRILMLVGSICFWTTTLAYAETTATWNGFTEDAATGSLAGVPITAKSEGSAPFVGITPSRFADSGDWDTDHPLSPEAAALVAANVNGGDSQTFTFAEPFAEGLLYIENFDSNSAATIVATGATTLELEASSPSISFISTIPGTGVLSTSNPEFDGEGDVILFFGGDVSEISISYTGGDAENGVFYGFATPDSIQTVPEPSGIALALLGIPMMMLRRRRQ